MPVLSPTSSPPYSPSTHTPSASLWTLVPNWARPHSDTNVIDTVKDLRPNDPVAVAVEDLQPKAKYVQMTLAAAEDIRFCEKLFDGWMTELNKLMSSSEKPGQLSSFDLERLKENSKSCSNATNEILRSHVRFAFLMAQRIDDASKPQSTLKYDNSETTRLASKIRASAESLSEYVTKMKDDLNSFVSDLEEVQVMLKKELSVQITAKKEPSVQGTAKKESWLEWILGLLKSLFNAIARFLRLATACIPIPTFLHSAEPRRRPVSALEQGAAKICTANSEPQKGKESESLESLILYFKKVVPREAQNAKKKLERFDVALDTMGLEIHMKEDRLVTLSGLDPAAVAKKWRDVAKQYQSMLPDDKGPTS